MPVSHRPFLDHPGVIPFAHRGGAEGAPENTLPAFEAAVNLGYRYLETDVHITRDGQVVAFHDSRLDRVTDAHGDIGSLPLAAVRQADAGYHFSPDGGATHPFRGCGVQVPLLRELLERFPDARFNIDAKHDVCVAPLIAELRRHGAFERVCIASFSDGRLAAIRRLTRGAVCTSMGTLAVASSWVRVRSGRRLAAHGADCVQVPLRWRALGVATQRFIAAAHDAGLPVHVWTVDDPQTMDDVLAIGVDGIMTDRPKHLREVMLRRGVWSEPHNRAEVKLNVAD